jgi:hypothetical protein
MGVAGGGGGIVPGANEPGAGDQPLNPAQVGQHGVPAGDAGSQQEQDQATEAANLAQAQPRKRTVTIAGRGPDGRANRFHVEEHGGEPAARSKTKEPARAEAKPEPKVEPKPDHAATLDRIEKIAKQLTAKRKVKKDAHGKVTGLESEE